MPSAFTTKPNAGQQHHRSSLLANIRQTRKLPIRFAAQARRKLAPRNARPAYRSPVVAVTAPPHPRQQRRASSDVIMWGYDFYGRLGRGTHTGPKDPQWPDKCPQCDHISKFQSRSSAALPQPVPTLSGVGVATIVCGAAHNVVVTDDAQCVLTWGKCHEGQSGHGSRWGPMGDCCIDEPRAIWMPQQTPAMPAAQQDQLPPPSRLFRFTPGDSSHHITTVAAGVSHVLLIASGGAEAGGVAWSWGDNGFGQLGLGDTKRRCRPVRSAYYKITLLQKLPTPSVAGCCWCCCCQTTTTSRRMLLFLLVCSHRSKLRPCVAST